MKRPSAEIEVNKTSPEGTSETLAQRKDNTGIGTSRAAEQCPYCSARGFVKRGLRQNQYQKVQLYLCRNEECGRTFTAQDVKGKHFPLNVVIEGISYYNLGFNLEETCRIIEKKFNVAPDAATLGSWVEEYKGLCRYERLRPYATKMCKPKDTIELSSGTKHGDE